MSESELKPCPFCGGTASIGTIRIGSYESPSPITEADGSNRWIGYFAHCMYCQATMNGLTHGYQTAGKARAAWNTRKEAA